jgi:hypothetical protein
MNQSLEIPRLKKHVLVALEDGTRIHADIYIDYPRSGAPQTEALSNFLNHGKDAFFPAHVNSKQFFLINKKQILYIQETSKSEKGATNTEFKSVLFFFSNSTLKTDIHLHLAVGQQRLSDALNQAGDFLLYYQYDCLTFINKGQVVKATKPDQ